MKRSTDRILTTHTGSLHRPRDLETLMARAFVQGDKLAEAAVYDRYPSAVKEIVRHQQAAGTDIVSDGECSKSNWATYVQERMEGLTSGPPPAIFAGKDREQFATFYADAEQRGLLFYTEETGLTGTKPTFRECTGPLRYKGHDAIQRDIRNFKGALEGASYEDAFMPVVAPGSIQPLMANRYYKTDDEYWEAIAKTMREEYRAIVDAGFILQVDDAFMPYLYDMVGPLSKSDFLIWAGKAIDALNLALEGIPEDKVRYHICWGSWNGPHASDLPLKDIVHLVLRVRAQTYSIEAANPRHEHEWILFKEVKLPDGKILAPGVVQHCTNVVEHPEAVAQRLLRFASVIGRENVIASTDCGLRLRIHPQLAWAKLKAMKEGADLATQELWKR